MVNSRRGNSRRGGRNSNNRSSMSRSRRRAQNYRRSNGSRAVLPPARSMAGHLMRNVIQTAWDIAQGALSSGLSAASTDPKSFDSGMMDDGWIFAQHWKQHLSQLFNEYKVHKITTHYMPYTSTTSSGDYIACLCDAGQNYYKIDPIEMYGQPGSVVRRMGQPVRLTWVPTEPEDRNWHTFGDNHKWVNYSIVSLQDQYNVTTQGKPIGTELPNVAGKVIIEVDASFRGKPSGVSRNKAFNNEAYLYSIRCRCRKCIRVERFQEYSTKADLTETFECLDVTSPDGSKRDDVVDVECPRN